MQSLARLLAGSYPFPIFSPDSKLIIDRDESYISHSPPFEGGVPDGVGFFSRYSRGRWLSADHGYYKPIAFNSKFE